MLAINDLWTCLHAAQVVFSHQWWDACVAVDNGQPGQTDDDISKGRNKERWDIAVSVVTKSQNTLQAFH